MVGKASESTLVSLEKGIIEASRAQEARGKDLSPKTLSASEDLGRGGRC